ncbi:YesL family protein [Radiobacillus sp. PE A8.2]|uniref:YesL family protein n=1 Tax=Radiobacillus sp. PE A8.2 TaxID=3380349 RepID=UPI00388D1165
MAKSLFGVTEWITRFAYINLLWIGFSILGLIVFGFFPATIAMFAVIRKWIRGEDDLPTFRTFWSVYKQEFLKGNLFGVIIFIILFIFYIDIQFMQLNAENWLNLIHIPIYLVMLFFTLMALYLVPVYVHYDISIFQVFKNAFLIMLINPIINVMVLISLAVTYYVMTFVPGLLFFFGGSIGAFLIMLGCHQAFQKIEQKKQKASEAN